MRKLVIALILAIMLAPALVAAENSFTFYSGSASSTNGPDGAGPITSGQGSAGANDPVTTVTTTNGNPAVILQHPIGWVLIPDTNWISYGLTNANGPSNGVTYSFLVQFFIPNGATNPGINVSAAGDDQVTVFLNEHQIGASPLGTYRTIGSAAISDATLFNKGSTPNVLRFNVTQTGGDGFGLDYSTTVNYTPAPALQQVTCTSNSKRGDATGEGNITVIDVLRISSIALGSEPAPSNKCCVDINGDGQITNADANLTTHAVFGEVDFGTCSQPKCSSQFPACPQGMTCQNNNCVQASTTPILTQVLPAQDPVTTSSVQIQLSANVPVNCAQLSQTILNPDGTASTMQASVFPPGPNDQYATTFTTTKTGLVDGAHYTITYLCFNQAGQSAQKQIIFNVRLSTVQPPSQVCTPGTTVCEGTTAVKTCNSQGTGFNTPTSCTSGQTCSGGVCTAPPPSGGADWQLSVLKQDFFRRVTGTCPATNQCLVTPAGSLATTNPADFFLKTLDSQKPRCITNGKFINDFYCENGEWSTRTKQLAAHLIDLGIQNSPSNFSVYCDNFKQSLAKFKYLTTFGNVEAALNATCFPSNGFVAAPCQNNLCVLKTPNLIAVGTTLNIPVNDQKSFLKALGFATTACNSVPSTAATFTACSDVANGKLSFNPTIQAVVFTTTEVPRQINAVQAFFSAVGTSIQKVLQYVTSFVNRPEIPGRDFRFFNETRLYNNIYYAKVDSKELFAFREEDQTPAIVDYVGVKYSNVNLGADPCFNAIKRFDDRAICEQQTGADFVIVAKSTSDAPRPSVQAFNDLTAKLRP